MIATVYAKRMSEGMNDIFQKLEWSMYVTKSKN